MADTKSILKSAFIDAESDPLIPYSHNFSPQFEREMNNIIKYQKGFRKLINTAGKKVSCFLLTALLCLTTVACSVKEIREPIVQEIEKFFVNAKELFLGTPAANVSEIFPRDITKIIGTSYISKSKKQYVIDKKENVIAFVELLSSTYWGEPGQFEDFDEAKTYWTFDLFNAEDKCSFTIKMCNDTINSKAKVAIFKDDKEMHFYITNQIYREILAFTNRTYYLHDSNLDRPDKEFSDNKKQVILRGLNDAQKVKIKKEIRKSHYSIEKFLLRNVSLLKEIDSIYWDYVKSSETFIDPVSQYESKFDVYNDVTSGLEYVYKTTNDAETKNALSDVLKLFEKSVSEHDLEGLFTVHEYIHDYDYYAVGYPTQYVYDTGADYQGLKDYFGHLS